MFGFFLLRNHSLGKMARHSITLVHYALNNYLNIGIPIHLLSCRLIHGHGRRQFLPADDKSNIRRI